MYKIFLVRLFRPDQDTFTNKYEIERSLPSMIINSKITHKYRIFLTTYTRIAKRKTSIFTTLLTIVNQR